MLKYLKAAWRMALKLGLILSAAATLIAVYLFVGGESLGPLEAEHIVALALAAFVFFLAFIVVRYEVMTEEHNNYFGNIHRQSLLNDGIYVSIDNYLRYVEGGDFKVVHRFWLAGIANASDAKGNSDLHVACDHGHAAMAAAIIERGGDPKKPDNEPDPAHAGCAEEAY